MSTTCKSLILPPDMVLALLDGRKTQHRVMVKNQPFASKHGDGQWLRLERKPGRYATNIRRRDIHSKDGTLLSSETYALPIAEWLMESCPFPIGGKVAVKETWAAAIKDPKHVFYRADETTHRTISNSNTWRSPATMPQWAVRRWQVVKAVRVERVQDISEADALACGLDQEACAAIFDCAAGKAERCEAYHVENDKGDRHDGWLCKQCAEKLAKKNDYVGWGCTPESDGPAMCEKCGRAITVSLSEYGIDSELRFTEEKGGEPKYFPVAGVSARVAHMIADGIGDLQSRHLGRLAQIAYATHFNLDHGPGSWDANPYVWVLDFI